jgi:cell division transport system permease protein
MATVALALFCLAGAVLLLENAGALSARWGAPVRMTVYLADGADTGAIEALRTALAELPEVAETRYVSPAEARAHLAESEHDTALAGASAELFPATIEVRLAQHAVDADRVQSLAARVRRLRAVSDVETYRGLTDQMRSLMTTGRTAALALALLVMFCAVAVVGNTIRLSLHARMREVEVLRLVGASPRYVRAPFLMEGAMLGGFGATVALALLAGVFFWVRGRFGGTFASILGLSPMFLSWAASVVFVLGGAALGTTGSALALRRWLRT